MASSLKKLNLTQRARRLKQREAIKRAAHVIKSIGNGAMGCVKNITCKVIKCLEGLEHLEMVDIDTSLLEDEQLDEDGEDREVEEVFYPLGKEAATNGRASSTMSENG